MTKSPISSAIPPLEWQVGSHPEPQATPERWIAATVPGAVQLDWARAEGWPPHWVGNEFRRYGWMEDAWWTYRTTLPALELREDERAVLEVEGVDYAWSLWIDGEKLHEQEGMFRGRSVELPAAACAKGVEVRIVIAPAPKSRPAPVNRSQADHSCKPAVSYGWDFHPRLIPLGIWRPVRLEIRPAARLLHSQATYRLDGDDGAAVVRLACECSAEATGHLLRWELRDPQGEAVGEATAGAGEPMPAIEIRQPQRWWPNGYGSPALYTSTCTLLDPAGRPVDTLSEKIGFRRVRLVPHPATWEEPSRFPKGPSTPPVTLEINGIPIFAKGSNLVPPDIFPGAVTRERWKTLLDLAHGCHFNLLRLWGGGPVPGAEFFELCDELGLLVWVEFPLACNQYPDDAAYLGVLDAESRAIITRLRSHACVALWCGGNELFNGWSGMTPQSHAIRLLDRNCFDLDPERPFLPTAPVFGMGHGHYTFYDSEADEEAWRVFQRSGCTAYTEFGIPGPSPEAVLRSFLPQGDLFPPKPGTVWETHHAFNVWLPESHLLLPVIERYFGPVPDLPTLVARGQWLQAEGLRGLFEEARRQKPVAAMALNWCLNEPWPCAANNSLLAWPAEPKAALHAVREACRPTLASARIPRFQWSAGEAFSAELWLLHDSPGPLPPGRVGAVIVFAGERHSVLSWTHEGAAPMTNLPGPTLRWQLPHADADHFELCLEVAGNPEASTRYRLSYREHPLNAPAERIIGVLNF